MARTPSAKSLLAIAIGHAASAEVLHTAGKPNPDNGTFSASMWFLMGWSLEAALKAAIIHYGGDDATNRRIGHDLPAALREARARGFKTALVNVDHLARDLAPTHGAYFFRYMVEGDTEVPGDSLLALAVLKALILEIKAVVISV